MADAIPNDPQTKTCSDCAQVKPLVDFRFRVHGRPGRQGFCRSCYNARMREYRGRQRDKLFNRFGAELARARSTSAVNVLASAMLRRFGSPDRLGEAWAGAIETARKSRRSVRSAILSYFAILRAMDHAEGQDTDPLGLKTANAKELKEAMYEYLLAHPEDALAHPEIKVSSVNAGRCREQASPQDSLLASGLPQIANGER